MAVLPKASFAVTVVENATPAVCGEPAVVVTVRVAADAGATVIAGVVPVIEPVTVSVAVIVWRAGGLQRGGGEGVHAVVAADEGVVGGQHGLARRSLVKWTVPV